MRAALPLFALCCALAAPGGARAEWFADAGTAFFHDDNVSRAQRGSDIRSDHALVVHASGGYYMQLTDRTGATLAATVRREQFSHYPGLSHVGVGPSASVRTKLGLGPAAPWARLEASALRLEYDNDVRTGWLFGLAGAAGMRVHERLDVRAELRLERRNADREQQIVRAISGAAFDLITNLTELNSSGMDHLPWVSADGLSLYFSSDRAGDLDIHRATRASIDAAWQPPERVTELNTTALEGGMTLSSDEGEIFFASNRLGTSDLFRAVRAPGQTTFGAPEPLAALNSAAEDTDPALSPDGTALYFASTREGTDSRIWRVSRSCP